MESFLRTGNCRMVRKFPAARRLMCISNKAGSRELLERVTSLTHLPGTCW